MNTPFWILLFLVVVNWRGLRLDWAKALEHDAEVRARSYDQEI